MTHFFVTGTDTGVGKTRISVGLLTAARARGLRTIGLKPVSAGCGFEAGEWVNEDARLLQATATVALDYADVNPVALRAAMAPHLAAMGEGIELAVAPLAHQCRAIAARPHDLLIAEGAGGWLVPLNRRETMADLARSLGWPVVLVVGMRLGCLNHALLTAAAIHDSGLRLAGWVANSMAPAMPALAHNITALEERLGAPRLGTVPWFGPDGAAPEELAALLDLEPLLGQRHA